MESLTSFFRPEDDILYRLGEKKGKEEGKLKFVTSLLRETDFSAAKIASMADVTVEICTSNKGNFAIMVAGLL